MTILATIKTVKIILRKGDAANDSFNAGHFFGENTQQPERGGPVFSSYFFNQK